MIEAVSKQGVSQARQKKSMAATDLALLGCKAGQIMAESTQQAPVTLATQKIKADASLLAVHADNESHIMRKFAAAPPSADSLGEVKADLCLRIIASTLDAGCSDLAVC